MLNSTWIRYLINEYQKLIQHSQLRVLWFLIFIISLSLAVFIGQIQSLNPYTTPINDLRSKLSMFFLGIEILILPLVMFTFFIGLQIEYRHKTFLWPVLKTIDDSIWLWAKWITLFGLYVVIFLVSMVSSILWIQLSHTFKNIDHQVIWYWFWQLAFHFIFLPIPTFLTIYLVGIVSHRYALALLVVIGLTYAIEQQSEWFSPYFALRYSLNLNMLLLTGNSAWKYADLYKYYLIATAHSITMLIVIRCLISRIGIYRLFNL